MRVSVRAFFLFGGLAVFTLAIHSALAVAPAPVSTLAIQNGVTSQYQTPANEFQSSENLTFRLSVDDPDQVNGSLNYTLYQNQTGYVTGWLPVYNFTHTPVPNRPGWVYTDASRADFSTNGSFPIGYNLTVANYGSDPRVSVASCLITVNAAISGTHDQCGANITSAPVGLGAIVNLTSTPTSQGNVRVSWVLSASDVNQTLGNFTYRVIAQTIQDGGVLVQILNASAPQNTFLGNGTRAYDFLTSGAGFDVQFSVFVQDPDLHLWSNLTCFSRVRTDHALEAGSCNGGDASTSNDARVILPAPTVPLLDVQGFQTGTGISSGVLQLLLGVVWVGLVTGLALLVGGPYGAVFGLAIGTATGAAIGVVPAWVLLITFGLAAGVVVTRSRVGGA